ncbi:hypothetical protein P9272_18520 [Mesorhizobium sp. WSM4976]|uniref:hypothetical protein n=1 Tax=Mesorhizobium sp. WSM4976 TaxID=3038549 RepID=UPI002415CE7A|nr:hypothetical protein [Mesorhizobium sp. WSM4976]MDG4895568.1 hypothetical protein [Mesorhizobium sp. WSM4976]
MPTMVTINGVAVDAEDPCALYQALYAVKLGILAGEHVEELQIQSPVTRELMRVSSTSMAALDQELMRLSQACAAKTGGRVRYAKRIRFTC